MVHDVLNTQELELTQTVLAEPLGQPVLAHVGSPVLVVPPT